MSLNKAIENVIIFGGIGAMAYMLLKKPKHTKEQCEYDSKYLHAKMQEIQYAKGINRQKTTPAELKKLQDDYNIAYVKNKHSNCRDFDIKNTNIDETIDADLDALCAEKKPTPSTDVNLYNRCTENLKNKSELWKPLIDPNAMIGISPLLYSTYDATYRSLYLPTGDLKANTCGDLDISVKKLNSDLMSMYDLLGSGLTNYKSIIATTEKAKLDTEEKIKKFNCRAKIEAERTKDLIGVQTKSDIKAEESIVSKSFKEQKAYIILGGLILLTGFYIAVKK